MSSIELVIGDEVQLKTWPRGKDWPLGEQPSRLVNGKVVRLFLHKSFDGPEIIEWVEVEIALKDSNMNPEDIEANLRECPNAKGLLTLPNDSLRITKRSRME